VGIIETITPSVKAKALIKRTGASTVSTSVIPVMYYNSHEKNSSIMYYKLPPEDVTCHTDSIDLLWKISIKTRYIKLVRCNAYGEHKLSLPRKMYCSISANAEYESH